MKKAAPSQKQSSPTRLQITAKHYVPAILDALSVFLSGVIALALIAWALGVLA